MEPDTSNRFGCLNFVVALILFATLGWGLLCYDPGFAEYQSLCDAGKGRVLERIATINSYVDATSTGCSSTCLSDLRSQLVSFVEFETGRRGDDLQLEFWKRNEIVSPPSPAGKYRVRLRKEDSSYQSLVGASQSYERQLVEACLDYQTVAEFVSRYELRETWVQKDFSMGTLRGVFRTYVDRNTGRAIATRGGYAYQGIAVRILPILTYQNSCGDSFFHFPELIDRRVAR